MGCLMTLCKRTSKQPWPKTWQNYMFCFFQCSFLWLFVVLKNRTNDTVVKKVVVFSVCSCQMVQVFGHKKWCQIKLQAQSPGLTSSLSQKSGSEPGNNTNYEQKQPNIMFHQISFKLLYHSPNGLHILIPIFTYLKKRGELLPPASQVPFSCSSRIAATITGFFDVAQGVGGALAWCNHPGPIQRCLEMRGCCSKNCGNCMPL